MEFIPAKTSAGRSARSACARMAIFTIEAESAAGTPCPATSAISTPRPVPSVLQKIVKVASYGRDRHVSGRNPQTSDRCFVVGQQSGLDLPRDFQFLVDRRQPLFFLQRLGRGYIVQGSRAGRRSRDIQSTDFRQSLSTRPGSCTGQSQETPKIRAAAATSRAMLSSRRGRTTALPEGLTAP